MIRFTILKSNLDCSIKKWRRGQKVQIRCNYYNSRSELVWWVCGHTEDVGYILRHRINRILDSLV